MDDQISDLLRSMIRTSRSARTLPTSAALRAIKDDFTKNGALGHGRFPVVLDQAAATEYELRVTGYLDIAKRVFAETETPWTQPTAEAVLHLLATELITDWEALLDQLRTAVGTFGSARMYVLDSASDRMRGYREQELSLLVIRQDRTRLPLGDALSVPRYATVLTPWQKADQFFRATPPDFANAAKEAVGAVEALARILTAEPKDTLGDSIKKLRLSKRIAAPLFKGLEELWGSTSDMPGVRHGGSQTDLDPAAARYIFDLSQSALRLMLAVDSA